MSNIYVVSQSAIDTAINQREALKKNNPFLYYMTGGDKATEYTAKNLGGVKTVTETADDVADAVAETFDIIAWIKENWQLAILGIVALLVLLRD